MGRQPWSHEHEPLSHGSSPAQNPPATSSRSASLSSALEGMVRWIWVRDSSFRTTCALSGISRLTNSDRTVRGFARRVSLKVGVRGDVLSDHRLDLGSGGNGHGGPPTPGLR